MIDSAPALSHADRTRYWYNRLGDIFSDLGGLYTFHGRDDRFGDEIAELGMTVSQLYDEIEEGKLTEAQAQQQAADLTGRLAALTARIYTDGRPFTATDDDAALVLDATLAAYDDATPLTLDDLDHVSAITGYNTRWLRRALAERTEEGLLAVDAVAGTWQVLDPEGLRTRDQIDTPTEQLPAGMSDEQALNLALALWADGKPFSPVELDGVLRFTGQSWTWLLARLGERVVTGLLAYDTATGYQVADPAALKALVISPRPTSATDTAPPAPAMPTVPALASQLDEVDAVDPSDALADNEPGPGRAAAPGRPAVRSGRIAWFFFALAQLALVFALLPTTPAPAPLTVALAAALAATGLLYRHLARRSN
ncbi:hypothetical protein AB0K21_42310 [Streptosporangium sp. NPDC049248]|uniref:hypothetical protein n=1 Tax=Streptosporangium sp. NPDC049248 TaxID=3155651 RepID=UPI003443FAB0